MTDEPTPVMGEFIVTGKRAYRDHGPGTIFEARLDRNAMRRAVDRGDIQLLRVVEPALQPGSFTFPNGWLTADQQQR